MAIPDDGTLQRLQIAEDTHGDRVHDWVAEGMPADILGKTRSMEEFRERQAQRPPEVPTNIERQHRRSVLRSEQAAAETDPAGEAGVPESVREVIASTGRSLDASVQRAMEDRMGDSLGDVRIHTGPQAVAACEAINARAFTVGNHIAFNQGEYDPDSPEGQHVLAHELAHVRQQTGGAVSMLPQEDVDLEVDPDPALEREAEETAQQVMEDGPVVVNRMGTEMHIQRWSLGDNGPDQSTLDAFEDGEFDGSTAESSLLEQIVAKLDPRKAAREGGRDAVKAAAKNDTVVRITANIVALVSVSGPVGAVTGDIDTALTTQASATAVIERVGAQQIRSLSAASAAQVYDALVEVGYSRLAEVWQEAVKRVRSGETGEGESQGDELGKRSQ